MEPFDNFSPGCSYRADQDIINQFQCSPLAQAPYKEPLMPNAYMLDNNFENNFAYSGHTVEQRTVETPTPEYLEEQMVEQAMEAMKDGDLFDAFDPSLFDLGDEKKVQTGLPQKDIHGNMANTTDTFVHSPYQQESHQHKIDLPRHTPSRHTPYPSPQSRKHVRHEEQAAIEYIDVGHSVNAPSVDYPIEHLEDQHISEFGLAIPHETVDQTIANTPLTPTYDGADNDVEVLIVDPVTKFQYSIGIHKLSRALEEHGTPIDKAQKNKKTQKQIQELVKKFCNARDLSFMKSEDAKDILDSGRDVVRIPLKGKKESGTFQCLVCPLLQHHGRGFDRKEDMKRHYQLHFKFARFMCKHCQYGNARTDHMKLHIVKCHPGEDEKDYDRA